MKKDRHQLASSDGWTPMPPTPNQRRAPLTGAREVDGDEREDDTPARSR